MITLAHDLDSIHHDLGHRLSLASSATPDLRRPRDHYTAIDTFLAAASRHNSAMVDAIAPLAHEFLVASRAYEESLAQVKAKLYGSTFAAGRPWPSIWQDVLRDFDVVCHLEVRLAEALLDGAGDDPEDLGTRLHHAELTSPSRPHRGSRTRASSDTWPAPSPAGSTSSGTPRRGGWCPSRCATTTATTRGSSPSTSSPTRTSRTTDQLAGTTMRTGPRTSSRTSRDWTDRPPITVGATHHPGRSSAVPPVATLPPSDWASAR